MIKPVELIEEYQSLGYYVLRTSDLTKAEWGAYTKDYKIGDKVYWLGHDGVHGFWYEWDYIADQSMIDNKDHLDMYKRVGIIK